MVNETLNDAREAERSLALSYAPDQVRPALLALFALDRRLGDLLAGTREPLIAQMRLTWWYEALGRLDSAPPPAEPILTALAADVLPRGVTGAALAALIDGWEALLDPPIDAAAMEVHAQARGGRLFALAAQASGGVLPERAAGEGWALADVSQRMTDPTLRKAAAALAETRLKGAMAVRWPRALRSLGALTLLARADVAGIAPGSPRRMARLLRHRLTGR